MNWVKWTSRGWQAIKRAVIGEDEEAELMRLTSGLEELHRVATSNHSQIIEATDDRPCACCGGKRCWSWRSSKHTVGCGGHTEEDKCWRITENGARVGGCGGESEPIPMGATFLQLIERAIVQPGRHTLSYVTRNAVPWNWNPIPLYKRAILWPAVYERKLGRPLQLNYGARRLAGVLP